MVDRPEVYVHSLANSERQIVCWNAFHSLSLILLQSTFPIVSPIRSAILPGITQALQHLRCVAPAFNPLSDSRYEEKKDDSPMPPDLASAYGLSRLLPKPLSRGADVVTRCVYVLVLYVSCLHVFCVSCCVCYVLVSRLYVMCHLLAGVAHSDACSGASARHLFQCCPLLRAYVSLLSPVAQQPCLRLLVSYLFNAPFLTGSFCSSFSVLKPYWSGTSPSLSTWMS